ncbi:transposase (plasmid) [Rhodococcus opacus]
MPIEIIKRIPGSTGFHVRPRVWVVERSFAWINKHRRCVRDYETRPDHHEAMVHIAMIATMTRRLART